MKPTVLLAAAFRYFCVATVLTQIGGAALLAATGALQSARVRAAFAAIYDIGPSSGGDDEDKAAPPGPADAEWPSHEEVDAARFRLALDLDLRETALEKALVEYDRQDGDTQRNRTRYDRVKADFDLSRQTQLGLAANPSLQEVRRTLEVIKPAQAKEELRKMLADGSRREVVALLRSMPMNKRKKIVAEFKSGREADELEAMFKDIRLGEPEVELIRQTRAELELLGAETMRAAGDSLPP